MKFGLFGVGLVAADLARLEQKYVSVQNDVCDKVKASIPSVSASTKDAFMQSYKAFDGSGSEDDVLKQARQILSLPAVQNFFSLPDTFDSGGLDDALVKCAVLSEATPQGLAKFASQGEVEETLVNQLLGDTLLQRDMLVSGGARSGKYAEAMAIYQKLQAQFGIPASSSSASGYWDDYSQNAVIRRLAIATSVEHAVPRTFRFQDGQIDPVELFSYFQTAYHNGDLDPNFEILTAFECRGVAGSVDSSIGNLTWMRETQANFHPDHLVRSDVATRYMQAVHTDVPYQHPNWPEERDYTTIPAAGGECGPRAWFGRFARWAYGLPTWGHQQPGHAAMSTWTPSGWRELLGRPWEYSYWEGRGGPDYYLETETREFRSDFQKVLRGQWVASALGEDSVNPRWTPTNPSSYGQGGFWSALMLYLKKTVVADNGPAPVRPLGKSVVPTKIESLMQAWSKKRPTPVITTDSHGMITIPAAAISAKNGSVTIMPRADSEEGEQLLHGGGGWDVDNHAFEYEVSVDEAGTFYLVANFSTWHMNLDLFLTGTAEEVKIPVFWSHGHWMETQPVEIKLSKGKNVLRFSRRTDLALAFKEFFLFKSEPVVPTPDPHDLPVPTPPPTPLSDYIIQPNRSSCEKDGLTELTAEQCQIACEFFGYKDTGSRNRPNAWPGCFVLGSGPWKGNCNFNSNTQGDGSDVTQLAVCSRHAMLEFI